MKLRSHHNAIGVTPVSNDSMLARVWAPHAKQVSLVVSQNGATYDLKSETFGYWSLLTDKIKTGDRYYFSIDGQQLADPASKAQPDGVHGPSMVVDLTYPWTDKNWNNIPLKEYIIYELHVGTFTEGGTFTDIESKLDYLKELGITAIELMPIAQFPGVRNWGYDGVFPFAVQNSYGGPAGLQQLINACHLKGLAVIVDVVYNHLGPEGNILSNFGPYFTDKYKTPWGQAVNFDDAYSDEVRHYFIQNALMWFRDFHVDALRLDAVHAIKDLGPCHFLKYLRQEVDNLMANTGRTHYLFAECDLNDTRYIDSLDENGYGMDAQWIDEFHHALRVAAGQDKTGYYADFEGIPHLAKAYRDGYVYDGLYSDHRKKKFGTSARHVSGQQFIVFSQNHDHVGNRMLGERTSQLLNFEQAKLMAGAVLISPYVPLLFMGEEYGEPNPFLYFIDHSDPELLTAVREGRKKEFAAFHQSGSPPDPAAPETFRQSKLSWPLQQRSHQILLKFYQHFISLRKQHPALRDLDRRILSVRHDEPGQLVFLDRNHNDERIYCVLNFAPIEKTTTVPPSSAGWIKMISSSDTQWGGNHDTRQKLRSGAELSIPPHSIVIYLAAHE